MRGLVYAYVLARSGSKGLVDKNILPAGGHPLMAYVIAFGKALGVDRLIVSTDSEHYAAIARHYGAECPYLRGAEASSDTAMDEDVLADLAANLPKHGIPMPEIWVRLKPTNPFQSLDHAKAAIEMLRTRDDIDGVRNVTASETRLCLINEEGLLEPWLDSWPADRSTIRRTEAPTAYQVYNLDIFRHANWEAWGAAYMGRRIHALIGEAITAQDVNDADDFELVKALIEARPAPAVVARHLVRPDVAPFAD